MSRTRLATAALTVVLSLAGAAEAQAIAYHFPVTTTLDRDGAPCDPATSPPDFPPVDQDCSLREAIKSANSVGSNGTVDIPPGQYLLTLGPLSVTAPITVAGKGAARDTTINGGDASQVLTIANASASSHTKISGVTIAHGNTTLQGGGIAITSAGPVDITDSAVVDHLTTNVGAGIFLTAGGNLTLTRSLVARNSTPLNGGGLYLRGAAGSFSVADISRSTFTENSAAGGSAIHVQPGNTATSSTVNLNLVTIARNTSSAGGMIEGEDADPTTGRQPGAVGLLNTIVADPLAGATCGVNVVDHTQNIDSTNDCALDPGSSFPNTDPKLGPLEDNGGPTDTLAIGNGSPALDVSVNGGLDQRGVDRDNTALAGPHPDVGAYEAIQTADLGVSGIAAPASVAAGESVTYVLTVASTLGAAAPGSVPDAAQPRLQDTIPAGTTFVGAVPSQGSCTGSALVSCKLGRLANGSSATVAITVRTASAGNLTNTATVSSPRFDANAADDSASTSSTVTAAPAGGGPGGGVDKVAPRVSGLTLKPSKFRAGPGTSVGYTLTEPATARFTVTTTKAGRRSGKKCVKPAKRNRGKPKCRRTVTLAGGLTQAGALGSNSLHFSGRLGGHKLAPGSYRLIVRATDAAGNRSAAVSAAFKVVRR
jgi:CSLREA domain-containing protein